VERIPRPPYPHRIFIRPRADILKEATAAYFDDLDFFGQWIEECCETGPRLTCRTASLFDSWKTFPERSSEPAGSTKTFSANLSKREFMPGRTKYARQFSGISIKKPDEWQDAYDR